MSKNKDFPLPHYFNDGLKFGDPAQINYLKTLRVEAEEEEEMLELGMSKYRVIVRMEGGYTKEVWAVNEDDAEAQVADEFDIDYVDFMPPEYDAEEL